MGDRAPPLKPRPRLLGPPSPPPPHTHTLPSYTLTQDYKISYPGLMLNVLVAQHNTNTQVSGPRVECHKTLIWDAHTCMRGRAPPPCPPTGPDAGGPGDKKQYVGPRHHPPIPPPPIITPNNPPPPPTAPPPQYQTLVDPVTHRYETSSEMSIEFEVDGPYKVGQDKCEDVQGGDKCGAKGPFL